MFVCPKILKNDDSLIFFSKNWINSNVIIRTDSYEAVVLREENFNVLRDLNISIVNSEKSLGNLR